MPETLKIAVVTPYYKQEESILLQCRESVRNQTHPCTHIVVADGHPSPIFNPYQGSQHIILPQSNADYGNTPRAIGGMLADSYGFDAVAFLDDDNWFEPNHLETMVAAHRATGAPLVSCRRLFRHLSGALLEIGEDMEDQHRHVDANCWLIFRPAYGLFSTWRIPKASSYIADRVLFQKALRQRYRIGTTNLRTVNYRTKHPNHYRLAGVEPPPGCYSWEHVKGLERKLRSPEILTDLVNCVGFFPVLL